VFCQDDALQLEPKDLAGADLKIGGMRKASLEMTKRYCRGGAPPSPRTIVLYIRSTICF
jgi:hypothetical protein